jgi:Cu/Ag efflux pump CusA
VPLEYTLSTTRNLEATRSISLFGLSDIRCYFSWESDYYWDNAETINQLQFVWASRPAPQDNARTLHGARTENAVRSNVSASERTVLGSGKA